MATDGKTMNRATLVYLVMAVALVAGLFVILRIGAGLRPPPDLAGTWQIEPADADLPGASNRPPASQPAATRFGRSMLFEQSGRFVRLQFEQGPAVDLKMTADRRSVTDGRYVRSMEFSGPGWMLSAEGDPDLELLRMDLLGPVSMAFNARRAPRRAGPAAAGH